MNNENTNPALDKELVIKFADLLDGFTHELRQLVLKHQHTTTPTPLLDAEGAAMLLGLSVSKIREMCWKDEIPHIPIGRSIRFDPNGLEIWWSKLQKGGE
jgi:excisionase family DNA binding protein